MWGVSVLWLYFYTIIYLFIFWRCCCFVRSLLCSFLYCCQSQRNMFWWFPDCLSVCNSEGLFEFFACSPYCPSYHFCVESRLLSYITWKFMNTNPYSLLCFVIQIVNNYLTKHLPPNIMTLTNLTLTFSSWVWRFSVYIQI